MRARVAQRAIPLGKLLRQEPILGGEAVGSPLKSLAAGLGRQSFGSLFGRLHGVSQDRRRRPQTRRLRVRGRLTFLASDVGESLVEFADQPGLDALGNRISPGFRNQPQGFAPVEQGPAPIDGGLRARAKRGVRRDEAGGLTLPSAPPSLIDLKGLYCRSAYLPPSLPPFKKMTAERFRDARHPQRAGCGKDGAASCAPSRKPSGAIPR